MFETRAVARLSGDAKQVLQAPKAQASSRGVWGLLPQKSLKTRSTKMLFLHFFMEISSENQSSFKNIMVASLLLISQHFLYSLLGRVMLPRLLKPRNVVKKH